MAQQVVRIENDLKDHLQNLARQEGKGTSDVVRDLVQRYVQDRDRGAALRALSERMRQRSEETRAGPEDVEDTIESVREKSRDGRLTAEGQK